MNIPKFVYTQLEIDCFNARCVKSNATLGGKIIVKCVDGKQIPNYIKYFRCLIDGLIGL